MKKIVTFFVFVMVVLVSNAFSLDRTRTIIESDFSEIKSACGGSDDLIYYLKWERGLIPHNLTPARAHIYFNVY